MVKYNIKNNNNNNLNPERVNFNYLSSYVGLIDGYRVIGQQDLRHLPHIHLLVPWNSFHWKTYRIVFPQPNIINSMVFFNIALRP
jgi:hypothetical protein